MLSQESWKEKGLGKGTNTYLGKVNRGNGSHGEFLWGCTMFVECSWWCRRSRRDRSSGTLLVVRRPPMIKGIALDELLGYGRVRMDILGMYRTRDDLTKITRQGIFVGLTL